MIENISTTNKQPNFVFSDSHLPTEVCEFFNNQNLNFSTHIISIINTWYKRMFS